MIPFGWTLKRIVDPSIEPVTLDQAKAQCRVDPDITESDERLTSYIKAARELAEDFTKRAFIEQRWRYTLPGFPIIERWWNDQRIRLPRAPLLSIDVFTYRNFSGVIKTMTPWDGGAVGGQVVDQYWLSQDDEPPAIEPPYGSFWPIARDQAASVVLEYTAGYPSAGSPVDAANVPEHAKQAILQLVGHWYANRESVVAGPRYAALDVPFSFERGLDSLRIDP